jgi:hypothetical protein
LPIKTKSNLDLTLILCHNRGAGKVKYSERGGQTGKNPG